MEVDVAALNVIIAVVSVVFVVFVLWVVFRKTNKADETRAARLEAAQKETRDEVIRLRREILAKVQRDLEIGGVQQ